MEHIHFYQKKSLAAVVMKKNKKKEHKTLNEHVYSMAFTAETIPNSYWLSVVTKSR